MQPNSSGRTWALGIVVFAAGVQLVVWWFLWDDVTFGTKGPGTQVVRDMFGKGTSPGDVAAKLEDLIRLAVFIVLVLLAMGPGGVRTDRRTARRRTEPDNPFA